MDRLRNVFLSDKGYKIFEQYDDEYGGVGIVSAKRISDTPNVDDTKGYSRRVTAEFTVSCRFVEEFEQDYAEELDITIKGAN